MTLNILYGILVPVDVAGYYAKRCVHLSLDAKTATLRELLVHDVPYSQLAEFGCFLCHAVQSTLFWPEIQALDKNNTYARFSKDPSKQGVDLALCHAYDTLKPQTYIGALDKDITDRLMLPTWLDVAGAICLQLLRNTVNAR